MSRSARKGPYCAPKLLKKIEALNKKGEKQVIKTWARSSTVMPEMIGHYLGEYSLTRGRVTHGSAGVGATRSSKFVPLK